MKHETQENLQQPEFSLFFQKLEEASLQDNLGEVSAQIYIIGDEVRELSELISRNLEPFPSSYTST